MSKKLWGGRFSAATSADVDQYTASIGFDPELAQDDILGSLAHAAMLKHCSIIQSEDHAQLKSGLEYIAAAIKNNQVEFNVADEDIHMNIERLLGQHVGQVAGKLHTARSRNDQVALDLHLYLRKKIVEIVELLTQLQQTFLQLALAHQQTLLPGYTHMQRAQPMYLSHYWLAYFSMFQRDIERLQDSWKRVNVSPLGACALIGTTFATNKHYTAELLGFDGIYPNTLDAVSDRDFVVEFLAASALIMVHISRLSEELILWSSQEFNFISFADAYCTGSSIMPQKKNPDVVELARGKTGRVYGALIALLTILKGLPLAYNKDLQEDKEPLFDTVKTVSQTLMIFVPLLASLQVNKTAMRAAVTEGYLNATALAEHLVRVGLTFREAHEVVGKMVSFCISKNCQLEALTLAEMQQFADCLDEKVYSILVPENIVQAYGNGEIMEIQPFEAAVLANQTWIVEKVMLLEKVGNGLG